MGYTPRGRKLLPARDVLTNHSLVLEVTLVICIGNRSDPTRPVAIRVGSPQIPTPPTPTAQYAGSPYPHVVLQFQPPPAGLTLIVERQDQTSDDQTKNDRTKNGWIRIAGPMTAQTATDNHVPASASVVYRISYVSADGKIGPASTVVTISNPSI